MASARTLFWLLSLLVAIPSNTAFAQLTIRVDFNGSGSGTLHTSGSVPSVTPRCVGNCGGPLGLPTGPGAEADARQMQAFAAERLRQQRAEAEERARRDSLLAEQRRLEHEHNIENVERLQQLQALLERLDDTDTRQRYNAKSRILEAMPEFDRVRRRVVAQQSTILQRLSRSIRQIHVPPSRVGRKCTVPPGCRSVLFLGSMRSPQDARAVVANATLNPFKGDPYDNAFAFGTEHPLDLVRGAGDHLLGDLDRLTKATVDQLGELRGATIEELVAHSNGAKVAEVLIRTDVIHGVKVLRILGGDAALMDLERFERLAREKNLTVYIYATQHDLVPMVPLGWRIREWAEQLGEPLTQFRSVANLTYEVLGLKDSKATAEPRVHVQLLSYPPSARFLRNPVKYFLDQHDYANYHRIVYGQFRQGCLDAGGSVNPRCAIR